MNTALSLKKDTSKDENSLINHMRQKLLESEMTLTNMLKKFLVDANHHLDNFNKVLMGNDHSVTALEGVEAELWDSEDKGDAKQDAEGGDDDGFSVDDDDNLSDISSVYA